jgi:hypothetical protein
LNLIRFTIPAQYPFMTAAQAFVAKLSSYLFWDVDRDTIDPEQHAAFLICRVVERGSSLDVREAWTWYGEARIQEALVHAPSLSRKTINYFALQFRIPVGEFRSWQSGQHWVQ